MIEIKLNENFLDEVEKFVEKKLSQKPILIKLLKTVDEYNQIEKFLELTFTAKYVNGLLRAIKIAQIHPQINNIDQIRKDLSDNFQKVINILKELNAGLSFIEDNKGQHKEIEQPQLEILISLIDDLGQIKKYLNHIKRI